MQADQEIHQGIQQAVAQRGIRSRRSEDAAVRQREVEVTGDQDRLQLGAR